MSTTDVAVTATVYAELRAKQEGTDIGPEELEAWLLYADKNYDEDSFTPEEWDGILAEHNRNYQGVHDSFREFVEAQATEMWDIGFDLSGYIDWDSLESDWEHDYDFHSGDFGVHVWVI